MELPIMHALSKKLSGAGSYLRGITGPYSSGTIRAPLRRALLITGSAVGSGVGSSVGSGVGPGVAVGSGVKVTAGEGVGSGDGVGAAVGAGVGSGSGGVRRRVQPQTVIR